MIKKMHIKTALFGQQSRFVLSGIMPFWHLSA